MYCIRSKLVKKLFLSLCWLWKDLVWSTVWKKCSKPQSKLHCAAAADSKKLLLDMDWMTETNRLWSSSSHQSSTNYKVSFTFEHSSGASSMVSRKKSTTFCATIVKCAAIFKTTYLPLFCWKPILQYKALDFTETRRFCSLRVVLSVQFYRKDLRARAITWICHCPCFFRRFI